MGRRCGLTLHFIFATYYEYFASDVKQNETYHCLIAEGGMFIKGFDHISLRKFIDRKIDVSSETVDEVFSNVSRHKQKYQKDKEK